MCTIKALIKKCGINDPIPDLVYALDQTDITTIPAATTTEGTIYNTITTNLTLVASKFWKRIEFRRRSANFTIEDKGELDSNQYVEQKLIGFYPESDEESMYRFIAMVGWIGLIAYKNGNDKTVLWGTKTNFVELTKASFDASKGGWDLEFMRICPGTEKSPPFYTGTLPES